MNPNQFSNKNVILHEPVKNQIFNDSTFIRLVYSNNVITTNGIHLRLDIKGITTERKFNKTNVVFNIYNNRELIESVQQIEEHILSSADVKNKSPVYSLREMLAIGRINIHDFSDTIILKISGIWETEHSYGVTYKFV